MDHVAHTTWLQSSAKARIEKEKPGTQGAAMPPPSLVGRKEENLGVQGAAVPAPSSRAKE